MSANTQKRRSDRLMLTVPLLVKGVGPEGVTFETPARTIVVNRNGARVEVSRPLCTGQIIRLVNLIDHHEADFRVVELVSTSAGDAGEYGVECLEAHDSFWQIHFPPAGDADAPKALLECRMCHKRALAYLSPGEIQVLRTAGVVAKRCQGCNAVTPFKYAEISVAEQERAGGVRASAPVQAASQRQHRRVCLQLPVGLRDHRGEVEFTVTENVSREGFCFTSEREYQANQGVTLVFPGDATSENIETAARIVRREPVRGTNRKLYAVRYERSLKPNETMEGAAMGTS